MLKDSHSEKFYPKSMLAVNRILAGHGCVLRRADQAISVICGERVAREWSE